MSGIDLNWLISDSGKQILQSIKQNNKLKKFGLLERPNLPNGYLHNEEISYKILLMGRANSGKTAFIDALFGNKIEQNQSSEYQSSTFAETPGIHITHLFWPVKLVNVEKYVMFKLAFWDVGTQCSTKYDYVLPSCMENLDCIIFVFSWTDLQSFNEIADNLSKLENRSKKHIPKLVIGTKYDQIAHSEIKQELVDNFERQYGIKIIRYSAVNISFDSNCAIINRIAELLWSNDQLLANKKT